MLKDLSDILKALRGKETLRDAAKRIGISHTYLSILEKGYDLRSKKPIKPTPETLRQIADAYNYSYIELMHAAGYVDEDEVIASEINNITEAIISIDELGDLIKKYNDDQILEMFEHRSKGTSLTKEQVKKILSYVRFVVTSDSQT